MPDPLPLYALAAVLVVFTFLLLLAVTRTGPSWLIEETAP